MIEPEVMNKFWPPLVKEAELCATYPGYKYKYFNSFEELDAHFREICGEDWIEQEWAKFWIGQHNMSRRAFKKELELRKNGNIEIRPRINKAVIRQIIKEAKEHAHCKVTLKYVKDELEARGYNVSTNTVWRLMKEL